LRLLRDFYGCGLPIEIWHLPGEVSTAVAAAMGRIPGVVLRELGVPVPRRRPGIWAIKPLAVARSNFREVLLLDADNVPALNPTMLFETETYANTGSLFWPDYGPYPDNAGATTWRALSAGRWSTCPREVTWEMESGQLLVDKSRCAAAIRRLTEAALHLEQLAPHLPGDGGDKDLFQISWSLAGVPFEMIPCRPAAVGIEMVQRRVTQRGPFVGHTMLQHAPDGSAAFLHRTIDKHEDPFALAWECVAVPRPGVALPALELDRICPEARIKVRIVPVSAASVNLVDFDAHVPRGGQLRAKFMELAAEVRRKPWFRELER